MSQFEIIDGVAIIPEGVTVIDDKTFEDNADFTKVVIPNTVKRIVEGAFIGCSKLTEVVIPSTVETICGESVFSGCTNLERLVVERGNRTYDSRENCNAVIRTGTNELFLGCSASLIPSSVKIVGEFAFDGCAGLTDIVIPEGVVEIGRYAFYGCTGLTSIVIPSTVKVIGEGAFEGCENLTSIIVKEGNKVYDSRENCNAIIKTETNELIVSCSSTILPDSVELPSVDDYYNDFDDEDFGPINDEGSQSAVSKMHEGVNVVEECVSNGSENHAIDASSNTMEVLKEKYTPIFDIIVKEQIKIKNDTIFVLAGISPYVNLENYKYHITDIDTFDKEGGDDVFEEDEWADSVYFKLRNSKRFQIMSYQQYAYIDGYFPKRIPADRVVVVYDNLRSIFSMLREDYAKYLANKPNYIFDLLDFSGRAYYSLNNFRDNVKKIPFFAAKKELVETYESLHFDILDINSDIYAIDKFVNVNLEKGNFDKKIAVDVSDVSNAVLWKLEALNDLLSQFGGVVVSLLSEEIQEEYEPREETLDLLKKYWGDDAEFNTIEIYKNPSKSKDIILVSQGKIVETIIDEYNKTCEGDNYRDVFITAPTGAGKSLIFQLPAFYAAEKNKDVTIVVSPLKALMTDQVEILQNQRNYSNVEFINSDLSLTERENIVDKCKNGDVDILYMSPELLVSYDIQHFVGERKLGLLVVDEAHLVTTWGRNFRVEYWNLGTYIKRLRRNHKFPVVALTATAVYGGENDMVFDTIDCLSMKHPHKYIGNVRRDNIEFIISQKSQKNKIKETIDFVEKIYDLGVKTLVYAPFRNQVKDICRQLAQINVAQYHGEMESQEQRNSYDFFKSNRLRIMVATKAFGMGVDIPDIQLVYHLAPSGLVSDYVQEIGRVARDKKKNIQGFAALNFSEEDLRFSNILFSLSSISKYQLKAVMRKIIRNYNKNGRNRNLLVTVEDFAYIFDPRYNANQTGNNSDVFNKVVSALRMIEDDYVKKGLNVLVVEPKSKNTKVYARVDALNLERLEKFFNENPYDYYKEIPSSENYKVVELDLDNIWRKCFSNQVFSQVRRNFYNGNLLTERCGIDVKPVFKISMTIEKVHGEIKDILERIKGIICEFLELLRHQSFTQDKFVKYLSDNLNVYDFDFEKIVSFVLGAYNECIFEKIEEEGYIIRPNYNYRYDLDKLTDAFEILYENTGEFSVTKFLLLGEIKHYIRLCSLLETMNLCYFEINGGKDPKISLTLNWLDRLESDSASPNYTNQILESIERRHRVSCDFFKKFFGECYSNDDRWSMIEDFFLGKSNDEIFVKDTYSASEIDIIEHLKTNEEKLNICKNDSSENNDEVQLSPRNGRSYSGGDNLTIDGTTMTINQWIKNDPVKLHKNKNGISIQKDLYKTLMSKLEHRPEYFEYYKEIMGLNLKIRFSENGEPTQAKILYDSEPVRFYKWWKKTENNNKVYMTDNEKIALFDKVKIYERETGKNVLSTEHRQMIG